jgi:Gpi18-like mannosyltransferase
MNRSRCYLPGRVGLIGLSAVAAVLIVFLLPDLRHPGDYDYWYRWSLHLRAEGITGAYAQSEINYPPLLVYVLAALNHVFSVERAIQLFKLVPLVFDFAGPLLLVWLLRIPLREAVTPLWPTFSVAYLFNTLAWGQVDATFTFFSVAAVLLALRNRPGWSVGCLALGLMAKIQTVVFVPLVGLLLLPFLRSPGAVFRLVGIFAGTLLLCCLPYVWVPNGLAQLWQSVFADSVTLFPSLSLNATNLWRFLFGDAAYSLSDQLRWYTLTYRQIGLGLFALTSFLTLFPLLSWVWTAARQRQITYVPALFGTITPVALLVGGTIPVLFFSFNTQMHERYAHPAMLFLFGYGLLTHRYLPYVLVSGLYFANLAHVLLLPGAYNHLFGAAAARLYGLTAQVLGAGFVGLVLVLLREVVRQIPQRPREVLRPFIRL